MSVNWQAVREQFPCLKRQVNGHDLVYFDSANTAQKFASAIAAGDAYYQTYAANVFRGVHTMGEEATAQFESARDVIKSWIGAKRREEVIFTRGTTEAINLLSYSWAEKNLRAGDVVLLTEMEHHANIVPWQQACRRVGANIQVVPVTDLGELDLDLADKMLKAPVKLFAFTHVSNAMGTINPVRKLTDLARSRGIVTVVDGSQAAPHQAIDMQELGADFYCFTGHKVYGPTGTGVLWGRFDQLDALPPFLSGGEMIEAVDFQGTTFAALPNRLEAGTPNIAGFIGLAAAIRSLQEIGLAHVAQREHELGVQLASVLADLPGLRLIGNASHRAPVYSFVIDGVHANDLAMLLDQDGIAIRSGQHCAHPLMRRFGVSASARASLAFYNTPDEIQRFSASLKKVVNMLR